MKGLKNLYIVVFLLYISGLPSRLGIINLFWNEIFLMFFTVTGILSFGLYLGLHRFRIDGTDLLILIFTVLYPILSSIIARITLHQPVYMGFLSFRGTYLLYSYYTLIILNCRRETILKYVIAITAFILLLVIVLFIFFNVNDITLPFRRGYIEVKTSLTTTKALVFSGYTTIFMFAYLTAWILFFEKGNPKYLILPLVIFISSVFISKGRIEIFMQGALPFLMYYFKYGKLNINLLIITASLIIAFFLIILTDNQLSRSYAGLLEPANLSLAQETQDYSAWLRLNEYKNAFKIIGEYPVTGTGNLSHRFNMGFTGLFSDFFFISDIGIAGVMMKGGFILIALYAIFYHKVYAMFSGDDIISLTGRYTTIFLILMLLAGIDFLFFYPGVFTVLLSLRNKSS
jgi:hypothetical protein